MVIVMKPSATDRDIKSVCNKLKAMAAPFKSSRINYCILDSSVIQAGLVRIRYRPWIVSTK